MIKLTKIIYISVAYVSFVFQSFKQMIASCLVKDPSKRPSAKKLLKHSFFKQARSNDYISRTLLEGLPVLGDRIKALKVWITFSYFILIIYSFYKKSIYIKSCKTTINVTDRYISNKKNRSILLSNFYIFAWVIVA